MKNKKKYLSILALAVLSLVLLAGFGERKWPMQITVVNRTTYPIADIRCSLTSDEDWGPNRIETTLEEGESADIDLGKFTEAELTNDGFNFQFYGEDGEPVNPYYAPQDPLFFEHGDYLILMPPDSSVSIFMDTGYDAAEYDQKIAEYSEQFDDGWGDLILDEDPDTDGTIPVLMGGALPFTNMQTLQADNYSDGAYYYMDAAEGGQIIIVNMAQKSSLAVDVQDLEDYLIGCALSLGEADTYELLSVYKDDDFTANLSYPVYIITYVAGENEDARKWTIFAADTDNFTYLYGFCATLDAAEGMEEVYQNIFSNLYLSESEEDAWIADDAPNEDLIENITEADTSGMDNIPELYQRNVSEFEGIWYYDGDFAAETFLVIDGYGNWSYYQRAPGEAEAVEMDCGILTYSTDEASTYYADSTMYDGVSIRVFDFADDVLGWGDEGSYYRME
ncbi:MAG: hypothetical protein Q4F41_01755 [Eubacteriales bacterium]|nr:hypothetical protein [Eubacteriales bacterium]